MSSEQYKSEIYSKLEFADSELNSLLNDNANNPAMTKLIKIIKLHNEIIKNSINPYQV